jgi:hypothetical protein
MANWLNLKSKISIITDILSYQGKIFYQKLKQPLKEKIQIRDSLCFLLNSELKNPVLINNKKCFYHWSEACNEINYLNDKFVMEKAYEQFMQDIIKRVGYVYNNLIFTTKKPF